MTQEQIRARIRRIVDEAPPLTDEQRTHIAGLLRPVGSDVDGDISTQERRAA